MDKVASAKSPDKPEERLYPGGEEILQRGTMHYGSISSIKDLKYLKMIDPYGFDIGPWLVFESCINEQCTKNDTTIAVT